MSAAPLIARGVQEALQAGARALHSRILAGEDLAARSPPGDADLLVVVPQDWEEMQGWREPLQQGFRACPWVLLADLRLAATFLASLPARCALLTPRASAEATRETLWALADGCEFSPVSTLQMVFGRGVLRLAPAARGGALTMREMQCGAAISLGLANEEICHVLSIRRGTLKSHIRHLYLKLPCEGHAALVTYFRKVFKPEP